jgi:hypothetical protein
VGVPFDTPGCRAVAEGLAHRMTGSSAGQVRQYVDQTIEGYSPSLTSHDNFTEAKAPALKEISDNRISCFAGSD